MQSFLKGERDERSLQRPRGEEGVTLDSAMDVSIIIVNWNTQELLHSCLNSIFRNVSGLHYEVIVVDNGSRDDSVQMVAQDFPEVRVLVNDYNVGFAAANNWGLSQAYGRYALLLNSDTIILPNALAEMVHYMDAHPCCGAVGPRLLNKDRSLQLSAHGFPRLDHDLLMLLDVKHWPLIGNLARWFAQRTYAPQHRQTGEVDWLVGACLMLRREAIDQMRGLDEGYHFFFEDSDLGYRLSKAGWTRVLLGTAEIIHLGGASRNRIAAASLVWYYKGLLRYYRLHSVQRYPIVRAVVVLGSAGHIIWRFLLPWHDRENGALLAAYLRIFRCAIRG